MNQKSNVLSENSLSSIEHSIRPMSWIQSLIYFGIPAIVLCLFFYGFRPWLEQQGYSPLESYFAALCVPLALMFAAALISYHMGEDRPLTWQDFCSRMRYPRLKGKDLFWGLIIFIAGMIGYGAVSQVSLYLVSSGVIPLPKDLPILANPLASFSLDLLDQAAGGAIKGQWALVGLALVTYFFNIVGEELWWRGIILPRQELSFGRYAWIIHGLMWASFHAFKWWDILPLIPVCLLISYSAQKLKNNWPALIGHALTNFLWIPFLILAVAGKM